MIKFYNTLTRKKEEFKPIKKKRAGIYSCGPTVYNYAHIGNLRSYVFADVLNRVLKYNGYKVKHVLNITDIGHLVSDADEGEDKMMKALRREGLDTSKKSMLFLAEKYTSAFKNDLRELNIEIPDKWMKATDFIQAQIRFIKRIEKQGFTYKTSDGIYFDTSKMANYEKLARLDIEGMEGGARVNLGEKRNKTDFALWKFPGEEKRVMAWNSPWGIGFPGWHIECSAMSVKALGDNFDIHTGGVDHIPVHHTNERAQNIAALGHSAVNYWLHNEWVVVKGGKMAKSEDNFITLKSIEEEGVNPLAYRYFLLNAHYRTPVEFSWEALDGAENALESLYEKARNLDNKKSGAAAEYEEKFLQAINDDMNTPQALSVVWDLVKDEKVGGATKKKILFKFDKVLGLGLEKSSKEKLELPKDVLDLVEQRQEARTKKDWQKSDELRDRISRKGFEIEDTKSGQKLKKADK